MVDASAKRRAAAEAAHRIRGVKAVANDIEVRLVASGTPTDAALTEAILSALEWNDLVPTNMLEATVSEAAGFPSEAGSGVSGFERTTVGRSGEARATRGRPFRPGCTTIVTASRERWRVPSGAIDCSVT